PPPPHRPPGRARPPAIPPLADLVASMPTYPKRAPSPVSRSGSKVPRQGWHWTPLAPQRTAARPDRPSRGLDRHPAPRPGDTPARQTDPRQPFADGAAYTPPRRSRPDPGPPAWPRPAPRTPRAGVPRRDLPGAGVRRAAGAGSPLHPTRMGGGLGSGDGLTDYGLQPLRSGPPGIA